MHVLHEDANLLVVDKPAGLSVIPEGWERDAPSLADALRRDYGPLWIVHRLDKVTSGVLVVARNAVAHRLLNAQFEAHHVDKVYHAVAAGSPDWEVHSARHPLRAGAGHRHRTVLDRAGGKPSRTDFRVLRRGAGHSLLEARPLTGRTHQVRAHAYLLGLPLLGDDLYGPGGSPLIARPALHALSIGLRLPASEPWPEAVRRDTNIETWELHTFTAPYPEDFQALVRRLFGSAGEELASSGLQEPTH